MSTTPKVSVIIPVYNAEKYLRQCLDSVINQTIADIEIICVNDGATDKSSEILSEYESKDSRIRVFSQTNQGQSVARNVGIREATGVYVMFLDSDDELKLNATEYAYSKASALDLDLFCFDAESIFETKQLEKEKQIYKTYYCRGTDYTDIYTGPELFTKWVKKSLYRASPVLQLIKRDFLIQSKIIFPTGIIHEDNLFTTELFLKATRVSHRNEKLYIRRVRSDSVMTTVETFRNLYGYFVCVIGLTKYKKSLELDESTNKALGQYIAELQANVVRIYNKLSYSEKIHMVSLPEYAQTALVAILNGEKNLLPFIEKSDRPLISVIIPVYNVESYIRQCLDSIVGQSLENIEILCVDDGTLDNSGKICLEYAKKDSRIKVIHQENSGLSAARNTGIENATGFYLAFVDSDDWIHPNFLETLYRLCKDNSCQIAECGLQKLFDKDEVVPAYRCDAEIFSGKDMVHRRFENNGWIHVVTWNKLYAKELFDNIRFPVGKQHEDEYTTYLLFWKSARVAYTDAPLYYYRQRKDSIMGNGFTLKSLDIVQAYEERIAFFKDKDQRLYKKSLIALACAISRNLNGLKGLNPRHKDLEQMMTDKLDSLRPYLQEIGVNTEAPIPDYPVFPHETFHVSPATLHYELKNEYCIDGNHAPGVLTQNCTISVIIPVFNTERYLEECLDSVLHQTLNGIEIIAINDGSTDHSLNILQEYAKKDPRISIINQPNLGVFVARNRGILRACGEFVCFLDSDDFYPSDGTLKLLYTKAKEHDVLICGGSFSNYRDGEVFTDFTGDNKKYTFNTEGIIAYSDYQFDYGYHRFIYNRRFLLDNKIEFPPYKRFQDPPFFVKAMITAKIFYAVPDVVYRYRVGFQAKPSSWPIDKLRDMLRGYLDVLNMSREARLQDLHAVTLRRLEDSYTFNPVMDTVLNYDYETLYLLIELNHALDITLLKKAGVDLQGKNFYVIRELKNIIWRYHSALSGTEQNSKTPIQNGNSSVPFTTCIYKFIVLFFRKCRGGIRCYQEHGMRYTLRRAKEQFLGLFGR